MTQARSATRRSLVLLCTAALGASGLAATTAAGPAAAAPATTPGHDRIVSATPKADTPNVQDESVDVIYDAGTKMIAGGAFSRVRGIGAKADDVRASVFAFDKESGAVDQKFAPVVDGAVNAIIGGPTAGTVYIGGRFSNVDENAPKRPKLALLNVSDGSVVSGFQAPVFNGAISDLKLVGDRLIVSGSFTTAKTGNTTADRKGLASLNAKTGALDEYLTVALTENHSWTEGSVDVAKAPVGADKLAVAPNGSTLVAIGNFKKADGEIHDQVVKIDLGETSAKLADWDTEAYRPLCTPKKFDSYVRDVAFSPDGSYFVIVTTGAAVEDTYCDTAVRWSATATGANRQPTWVARSGGDTFLSVGITEQAVYVGGHIRWINNEYGVDVAAPGAIGRASLAALDPLNGLPFSWNPGRNPRGYGVTDIYPTADGLWIGHDQEWIGASEYKHDRLAFFPLAGGAVPHATTIRSLPANVYTIGANPPTATLFRVNAGGELITATDGGPSWQGDKEEAPSRYHNVGSVGSAGRPWIANMQVPPIQAAVPRQIFGSQRASTAAALNQNWDFPVAKGTSVQVRLYFAARCACVPGRKFNVNIDGVRKLTDFDITAAVGNEVGTVRSFTIVSDGNIDIDLLRVAGYPQINAIEIVKTATPALVGHERKIYKRSYNGASTVGTRSEVANPTAFPFEGARGGFWIGGSLYFAHGRSFYRAAFDGTTLGTPKVMNPHTDPKWDTVPTYSRPEGQTFAGNQSQFFYELASITAMFYEAGRLYYTIAGDPALYWRWFTPDSGATGAVRNTVPDTTAFAESGGLFISDGKLFMVNRVSGNLTRMTWSDGAPSGTPATVSGPTVDGNDWRAKIVTIAP